MKHTRRILAMLLSAFSCGPAHRAPERYPSGAEAPAPADKQASQVQGDGLGDLFFAQLGKSGIPQLLADPDLSGEVTILAVVSSQIPACASAAPVLAKVQERYRDRGVVILGMAFESGKDDLDTQRVSAFAEKYALRIPFFLCGRADPEEATQALASQPIRSFPTFLVLNQDHELSAVLEFDASNAERLGIALSENIEVLLATSPTGEADLWSSLCANPWSVRSDRPRTFSGNCIVFSGSAARRARFENSDLEARPVDIHGPYVTTFGTWRFDPKAGVLLDPRRFGTRLFPSGGPATPLLGRLGYEGEEGCLRALTSSDPTVRREALFALGDLRREQASAPEAIPLLEDPALEVRVAAAWAVGEAREQQAEPELMRLIDSPSTSLRCEALTALTKLKVASDDLSSLSGWIEGPSDELARWAVLSVVLD